MPPSTEGAISFNSFYTLMDGPFVAEDFFLGLNTITLSLPSHTIKNIEVPKNV